MKIANYLYVEEVKELENRIQENDDHPSALEYENEIEELKAKIAEQNNTLNEIESKYQSLHHDSLESLKAAFQVNS